MWKALIDISTFNGATQCCVPYGGTHGVFETNPFAYAIPTAKEPIVLDMAATEVPFFEVKQAKENALPLKENVAIDWAGAPTSDAREALTEDGVANLLPIGGGFMGFGIVMLFGILTGSLVRSLLSTQQTSGWNPTECGCFILAIEIGSFCDPAEFKGCVSEMCRKPALRAPRRRLRCDGRPRRKRARQGKTSHRERKWISMTNSQKISGRTLTIDEAEVIEITKRYYCVCRQSPMPRSGDRNPRS